MASTAATTLDKSPFDYESLSGSQARFIYFSLQKFIAVGRSDFDWRIVSSANAFVMRLSLSVKASLEGCELGTGA
jgi:hypothetical protein